MFKVFQGNKPALGHIVDIPEECGWNKCEYENFEDALAYAHKWLGDYDVEITHPDIEYPIPIPNPIDPDLDDFIIIRTINN